MKWSLTLICSLFIAVAAVAAGPDDQYVAIYDLIQQGDSFAQSQPKMAAEKYHQAQVQLKQLQSVSPNWNKDVVEFRLEYLADKMKEFGKYLSAEEAQSQPKATAKVEESSLDKPSQSELERQLVALHDQVQQLVNDKAKLEAKLKEALAAQPAAVDPRELAKAQEKISALTKERDLLAATLEQERQKNAGIAQKRNMEAEVTALRKQLAAALEELANAKSHAQKETAALRAEIAQLKQARKEADKNAAIASTVTPLNANDIEKFNAVTKERDELKKEQENLMKQLANSEASRDELQKKADDLTKQFADLQASSQTATKNNASQDAAAKQFAAKLAEAQQNNYSLQKKVAGFESERADFKKQLDGVMKELADAEASRDTDVLAAHADTEKLRQQLKDAEAQIVALKQQGGGKTDSGPSVELQHKVSQLSDRLAVLEAKPIPRTAEELALIKKADARPGPVLKTAHSVKDLSATDRIIMTEGQRLYLTKEYADAEAKFNEVLKDDPGNVYVLAHIANTQLAENKLDSCAQTVEQAVALDPEDAACLYILGKVRLRQDKVDAALDALSHSARLNPTNALTQTALGNALNRKGLRDAAETALRKALQVDPDMPEAHHNLALVYATDRPPSVELAKWHYKKAMENGQPKDDELEKLLK